MLKFISRLEKTRNFILLVFAVLMVASLVFFYAPTGSDLGTDLTRSGETAASVAGERITVGELARQKETYSRFSQGRPYPARLVLNALIGSRILRIEAARMGLTASDAEVAAAIREQFTPTDGTPLDPELYKQNITAQYGSVAAFEEGIRDDLSAAKLRAFISAGVVVSEDEVLRDYQRRNAKFDLSYVSVNMADLAKNITPTEEELKAYFEKNKAAYYISEPQKKIRYVFLNTSKVGEKLVLTDADLRAEYDKLPDERKKAGVLGQEIVLRIAKPEFDGQVYEKALDLVQRLRKDGSVVSESAFAELARGHSENPASAAQGGKLRGPVRENLNKPDDPYQRLLRMTPGEVSEPINYQGRYFILRRGEDVPKPFEDAKKEIEVSLRNRRAYAATAELAEKVFETLKQNKDVQAAAREYAANANMNPAEMVRETPFIKPGDNVANIGISPQFEEGISGMDNANDVAEKIPIQNGFAIPLLVEKREPRDAELDEVRSQVVEAVKNEKARTQMEEIANRVAAGASSAEALAAAAAANNLKASDSADFVLGSPLGDGVSATTNKEIEDAIFGLQAGEVTKTPLRAGDGFFIVGVKKRTEANMDEFAKQKDNLTEQMLNRKRSEVFENYVSSVRQKMEAAGQITIYDAIIQKIDEADAATPTFPTHNGF